MSFAKYFNNLASLGIFDNDLVCVVNGVVHLVNMLVYLVNNVRVFG